MCLSSAIVAIVLLLAGLGMVAGNGFYIFQVFDDYAAGIALLVIALFQCIGVAWIYGNERYILVTLRQYFSVIPSGYIDLQVKLIIIPYLSISKSPSTFKRIT